MLPATNFLGAGHINCDLFLKRSTAIFQEKHKNNAEMDMMVQRLLVNILKTVKSIAKRGFLAHGVD